jgi:CheY-like chemotaxis protein
MDLLKRILFVEDSENDIELTLNALADNNFTNRVDVVRDGEEALDYLYCRNTYMDRKSRHPIVVLLDIKLPKMTGLEVLREIKADVDLRTIPVVILTSSKEKSDMVESYHLGVNAYVVKPVEFQKFVDSVKQLGVFWAMVNEPLPFKEITNTLC